MININISNVERMVIHHNKLLQKMPDLLDDVGRWVTTLHHPDARKNRKSVVLDILAKLEKYTDVIEEYYGDIVVVEKIDYKLTHNIECHVGDDLQNVLCRYDGFKNLALSRVGDQIYLSVWR